MNMDFRKEPKSSLIMTFQRMGVALLAACSGNHYDNNSPWEVLKGVTTT